MPKLSSKTSKKKATPEASLPAISVSDLAVNYGNVRIVRDISFDVAQGSIAAMIGPNGSGKTTVIRAMLGLLPKAGGGVRFMGQHLHATRQMIGYAPQRLDFDRDFPITVGEYLDLSRRLHCDRHFPKQAIHDKIREVGLPAKIAGARLGELSGGQLKRIMLAQAIINDPLVLILDEPAANIDIAGEENLYEILAHLNKKHNTTILMVTHDISMISKLVDTVVCVNHKMVCYGPPTSALTEAKVEELFGSHTHLFEHNHDNHDHEGHDG